MAGNTAAAAATATAGSSADSGLWRSITERYDAAQRDAAASMTATNTETVDDGGVRFVLRVAAKLRDKPKPPPSADGQPKKEWRNPFLPYEQALWVADLGASHVLLLNKFNIVAWHCLVVTAQFASQLDDLDAADLAATWAVMQSMPRGGLAFYNCGPVSGASQPHKHLQIVPLPLDATGSNGADSGCSDDGSSGSSEAAQPPIWPAVAAAAASAPPGQALELRNLPFAAFAATLAPPGQQQAQQDGQEAAADDAGAAAAAAAAAVDASTGEYLAGVYRQLLDCCKHFVEAKTGRQGVNPQDGSLSYNMVCTRNFMMLVPRQQETDGPVSCNSVAFAGSVFVRSAEEQQYVAERGPMRILAATGYEW